MFKFGENWASFSKNMDEERINEAMQSLKKLLGEDRVTRKSFLDIGSGSGLFSIAAARLGARPVLGVDVDPLSVETSQQNAARWLKDLAWISFRHRSVLDTQQMNSLGLFDIVYSWGVLHHTGNMKLALQNAGQCVSPGGMLMIAIYNRHWSSSAWRLIKWLYNRVGTIGQKLLIGILLPVIFLAKWLVTFKNPLRMQRGMDFMHNLVDWVGGYPYEYASIDEMTALLENNGFKIIDVFPAKVPTGCNEFVCRKNLESRLEG